MVIVLKLKEVEFLAIKPMDEEAESDCRGIVNSISLSLALHKIGIEGGIKSLDVASKFFVYNESLFLITISNEESDHVVRISVHNIVSQSIFAQSCL